MMTFVVIASVTAIAEEVIIIVRGDFCNQIVVLFFRDQFDEYFALFFRSLEEKVGRVFLHRA